MTVGPERGVVDVTVPTDTVPEPVCTSSKGGPGLIVVFDGEGVVRRGVAAPNGQGAVLEVGRDTSRHLQLIDARASRHHASLIWKGDEVRVMDHGSRNGTFVDGQRLLSGEWVQIGLASTLRFGRSVCLIAADVGRAALPFDDAGLLWGSGAMERVRREIEAVAPSALHVLVTGDTGVGKERAARSIHGASGRGGELVVVNCGALPGELLESELFGHARGAFTGAERRRAGLIAQADGGTIFLDEIAELSPQGQAALLRFLDSGEVRSVGEDTTRRLDVRVISATHRDLRGLTGKRGFRLDLLHRLAAYEVRLPSLDERREDIAEFAARFARGQGLRLSAQAVESLLVARWDGSVRQLEAAINAGCLRAIADGRDLIESVDLGRHVNVPGESQRVVEIGLKADEPTSVGDMSQERLSKAAIEAALSRCGGRISAAAQQLGCSRSGLYSAMSRLGIDPRPRR